MGSAAARPHPNADVMRFVDATEETSPVDVVVVPTVDSVVDYAASVGVDLSDVTANGRRLQLELARAGDAESAIAAARAAGAFAIEVDVRNAVRGTVSLAVPNDEDLVEDLTLVEAVGAIEDRVEEGTYAATWYHPFEGGCITFEFDADGPGVESLVADAERAIGFVDLADLKRQAAEAGFILDEAELE